MKHLIIALLLFACSEQVRYEETMVEVTGIEQTNSGCIYSVTAVVPYQPYIKDKIDDKCGLHEIGDKVIVRWIAN